VADELLEELRRANRALRFAKKHRTELILRASELGYADAEIAKAVGLTRSGVSQILRRVGRAKQMSRGRPRPPVD